MPLFPRPIHSKLPQVGTTIFTVMSKLASDYNAINLSQGFPDFACSEALIELVAEAMKKGQEIGFDGTKLFLNMAIFFVKLSAYCKLNGHKREC